MKELIESIIQKHRQKDGIDVYAPATPAQITGFENEIGFQLPEEFREFYSVCNGFGCNEDIFNITPLHELRKYPQDFGVNWFYFAEYMISSDLWGLRITSDNQYEIFNGSYPDVPMTASLTEFLNSYLKGNVFDPGGLYDWQKELGII